MKLAILLLAGCAAYGQSVDRRVAEWTLSMGGRIGLQGDARRISDIDQLPKGDFALEVLDWIGINADPPDLERLTGLQHLKALHLAGPFWNRNADDGRDGSRHMQNPKGSPTLEVLTCGHHYLHRIRFHDQGLPEIPTLTT